MASSVQAPEKRRTTPEVGPGQDPDRPSLESIRTQLEKILASETFVRSERLSRFLRFTVEKTVQGQSDQLKEYLLGLEVYGRGQSFDPTIDSIVRVQGAKAAIQAKQVLRNRRW